MTAQAGAATAARPVNGGEPMLVVDDIHTFYGQIHALRGIKLTVSEGEVVTLIGANGAGKTTTLKTISGLLHAREGAIRFEGEDITRTAAHELVERGIGHAPEGRRIFSRLTVLENLQMGAFSRPKANIQPDIDRVFTLFPRLQERTGQLGGTLSGGEQQMLAIGRALMSAPRMLLLDEPSLGLAPILVVQVFETIKEINGQGTTVLLVEQNANKALSIADYGYVLETGTISLAGDSQQLLRDDRVRRSYLGHR
jgi:branched-chain amino acid transport system ATP-binding protein